MRMLCQVRSIHEELELLLGAEAPSQSGGRYDGESLH